MSETVGISRVSTQNRVVIPKRAAELLGLYPGQFVKFVINDDGNVKLVRVVP